MPKHGAEGDASTTPARGGAELSALIFRGDREALGEFYELWFDRLLERARLLTGRDESFCLDVVQEVMLRIVRSIRPMPGDDDVARWMNRVMHTTVLDMLRREARQAARQRRADPHATEGTHDKHDKDDERIQWLRQKLAGLPAEDRRLLWMRYGLGNTLAAAGALMGMTGDAAHGRLRRALSRLRASARREEGEMP